MRKSDKRNKPELDKIGTNKIGRIRQSKEEFFAPKGFTFNRGY